jgi:hypothetical protein
MPKKYIGACGPALYICGAIGIPTHGVGMKRETGANPVLSP